MRTRLAAPAVLLISGFSPALAQELTDEQLLERFEEQRALIGAAWAATGLGESKGLGAAPGLGDLRGVEIISREDIASEPAAEPLAGPAARLPGDPELAAGLPGGAAPVARLPEGTEAAALDAAVATGAEAAVSVALSPVPTEGFSVRLPEAVGVNVRVAFPFDSSVLTDDQLPKLDQLCRVMGESDVRLFRIIGHTDAAGGEAYNDRLSRMRAEEVRRYFIESCGVDGSRLQAIGEGERLLFDETDPEAAANRRVEFQALS